jgi:HicB family
MELGGTVAEIMADLRRAGAIGGEETARIVELLLASVEASVRLHLLEALYAAARELEASTTGVGVEIRLEGRDPVLSLVQSRPDDAGSEEPEEAQSIAAYADDELLRVTLRLPETLKLRVEQAAASAGASVNAWIVGALARSFDPSAATRAQLGGRMPRRLTGFVQG